MRLPSLTLSRPLLAWLREDPQWRQLDWRIRAALAWKAGLGSLNTRLSEAQPKASGELAPLLILGPWRSGTTVMHELLTAATGWPTPLTWQCMDACAFRLGGAPRQQVSIARPMDGLALGAMSPQEDEFALLSLGQPSAYRAFWMPHRILELLPTLDPQYWLANDGWLAPWESFLQAVRGPQSQPHGGLILKSPNHSFRARALLRRFPRSKIVWMLRDPTAVFHSNRKMWRQMFATHGLSSAVPDHLDRFLARALDTCAAELDWLRSTLPAGQFSVCAQEALQAEAASEVQRVLAELGLAGLGREQLLQEAITRSSSGRVETYAEPLPEVALPAIAALEAAQQRAIG